MKRKAILGTLALVMALSLAIPFAGVALAETERTSDITPDIRLVLDIRAPAEAVVGQPVVMQVVEKHTGRVVAGAGIWAIRANSLAANRCRRRSRCRDRGRRPRRLEYGHAHTGGSRSVCDRASTREESDPYACGHLRRWAADRLCRCCGR